MPSACNRLGLKRGETIAIVGGNRPEALLVGDGGADARRRAGAGLCRRGGRRTRLRAGARRRAFRRGRGPGADRQDPVGDRPPAQARNDGLRRAARLARLRPRHLRVDGRRHRRRAQGARRRSRGRCLARCRDRRRQGPRSLHHPLHLRHHRRIQGRGAHRRGSIRRRPTPSPSTNSTENDVALAYLPLAWVGDHYLNYAQGLVSGFCIACPENRRHRDGRLARDRADASISRRRARSKCCSRA